MCGPQKVKTLFGFFALCIPIACLWCFADDTASQKSALISSAQTEVQIPITTEHLKLDNGLVLIELQCGKAKLPAPNTLEKFTCKLRNNTAKNIVAVNISYSIILEENNVKSVETRLHTLDTMIHPDFYNASKFITPNAERIIEPPGPASYGSAVITGVEIKIDYVEFDDKSKLGDNYKAEQLIGEIREGAAKYKDWLAKKYTEHGKSVELIAPILMPNQPLPDEFKNSRFEQGARAYRTRLRRIFETSGAAGVSFYLNETASPLR
jgi:hypothetical protein